MSIATASTIEVYNFWKENICLSSELSVTTVHVKLIELEYLKWNLRPYSSVERKADIEFRVQIQSP
jgi:hypothetical protein